MKRRNHLITVEHDFTDNLPFLHVVLSEKKDEQLPGIIFVHGFTSAKEHNLHYAYYLAKRGFRVLLPEAPLHGERKALITESELNYSFWEIVLQMIKELEIFVNAFTHKDLLDKKRIGLAGTSMGGIVTLGALTQYSWVKAAVSLMGSPSYEMLAKSQMASLRKDKSDIPFTEEDLEKLYTQLRKFDLSQQPDKLMQRPLLFWHSEIDQIVPFRPTFDFYLKSKRHYTDHPDRIHFIADKTSGHKVSREGVIETVRWFEKYI